MGGPPLNGKIEPKRAKKFAFFGQISCFGAHFEFCFVTFNNMAKKNQFFLCGKGFLKLD